jgi:RES domain-containing protein
VVTVSRIVKAKYASSAFDGEGARINGGRWNSPGSSVVYTASSGALAALEMLVHLGRSAILPSYVIVSCTFEEVLVSHVERSTLPGNWRSYPAPPALQRMGDEWLKRRESAVLEVPSVIIDTESNYLLNPTHPDFALVTIAAPRPFEFDLRLLAARRT